MAFSVAVSASHGEACSGNQLVSVSVRYGDLNRVFAWLSRRVCINSNRAEAIEERSGRQQERRAARESRHGREEGARREPAWVSRSEAVAACGEETERQVTIDRVRFRM